jgi:GNAT superfamily N-acetyltransferase
MVGDVNLFLSIQDDEDEDGNVMRHYVAGEIELMIAPPPHRGKGLGGATLLAFLQYIRRHESEIAGSFMDAHRGEVKGVGEEIRIRVKIGKDNGKSLGLFKSAGFVQVREANYFGEVELSLPGGLEGVEAAEGWREERWETVS